MPPTSIPAMRSVETLAAASPGRRTSTWRRFMATSLGIGCGAMIRPAGRLLPECDKRRVGGNELVFGEGHALDHALARAHDGVLHLHRLEDHEGLALLHFVPGLRHDLHDAARHERGEARVREDVRRLVM